MADGAQRAHQRQPIQTGQHAIDDEDVVGFAHGLRKPVTAVDERFDDVPFLGEALRDVGRRLGIVFDD